MHIAVVGRGLIGSAAAKYLALAGHSVDLIGPDEASDPKRHTGVFASHYDEGRITRGMDSDPYWGRVSRAAIARYRDMERQSGIRFFTECGTLMAGPEGGAMIAGVAQNARADALPVERLGDAQLGRRFQFLDFEPGTLGFFETRNAGHISPRALVRAQGVLAERAGARIHRCAVSEIAPDGVIPTVKTSDGLIAADRVLIAAGGFTNMLLARPLPLRIYARTVAFFRIDEDEADRLRTMPSVIYDGADGSELYLLPPIRYPDGHIYLKIGGDPRDVPLTDADATKTWFKSGGSSEVGAYLRDRIMERIPGVQIRAMHTAACVTTFADTDDGATETGDRPVIRDLDDRVSVAVAGSGRGAKCSDELGRIAAALFE